MLVPQYSPIIFKSGFPYSEWIKHASSVKEVNQLYKIFNGTPRSWIEWVEEQLVKSCNNGIKIENQVNYRRSLLQNGIISLQEGKFICDSTENAIRHKFLECLSISDIRLLQVLKSVPDYKTILESYNTSQRDIYLATNHNILIGFTFYQLTETIVRNWKCMKGLSPRITGFNQIFWSHKHCRDVNKFQNDFKTIREYRNIIAHSRKLLTSNEVQKIYDISQVWLKPMGIDLDDKIQAYRKKRPYFLSHLT